MNDLAKKILELGSEDQEFYDSFTKAADLDEAVALLKAKGVEATAEELDVALKPEEDAELSDDELEAVAGGGACACVLGGGGKGSGKDETCACVGSGLGYHHIDTGDDIRCVCAAAGGGKAYN